MVMSLILRADRKKHNVAGGNETDSRNACHQSRPPGGSDSAAALQAGNNEFVEARGALERR